MRENKSNMPALVRAEHLKMKHTFVRILPAASAMMALFLVFSFSRGSFCRECMELVVYHAAAGDAGDLVLSGD